MNQRLRQTPGEVSGRRRALAMLWMSPAIVPAGWANSIPQSVRLGGRHLSTLLPGPIPPGPNPRTHRIQDLPMRKMINLNADIAEGWGAYDVGNDAELMKI